MTETYRLPVVEDGKLTDKDVPLRNAMNEVLRDEYIRDCERALKRWNKVIAEEGGDTVLTLPSRRFHRHQGIYADHDFDPDGNLISREQYEAGQGKWLLRPEDNDYLLSIMKPCYEPGKFANWISPPTKGIEGQPEDFEYVRLND